MAVVDIVEDALRVLQSPEAVARTLGISRQTLTRVLQQRHAATLEPAVVIRAARLTGRNICEALRVAGEPDLANELESILRDAHSPAQQAILDDLNQLPTTTRRHFVDLIAERAATARRRGPGK
jgi:plasmid maintenance system antidote protein VapI